MNIRILLVGISIFVFGFLAVYFSSNMIRYQMRSNECEANGGFCVDISEGCLTKGAMEHPEAECYLNFDDNKILDDLKVCCLSGG